MGIDASSNSEKGDLKKTAPSVTRDASADVEVVHSTFKYDHTKRKLKARHIQLIGIAGTIGTG